MLAIVLEGDFRYDDNSDKGLGWGGRTGHFWGGTYHEFFNASNVSCHHFVQQ
jgi:hypothetical protein